MTNEMTNIEQGTVQELAVHNIDQMVIFATETDAI